MLLFAIQARADTCNNSQLAKMARQVKPPEYLRNKLVPSLHDVNMNRFLFTTFAISLRCILRVSRVCEIR